MIRFFMNNPQMGIILLVVLSSVGGRVGSWFLQQKKRHEAQLEHRRREEEGFRTGRVDEPEEEAGPSPEMLEEMIAEQLRHQRQELLRQRAAQAEARRQAAQAKAEAAKQRQDVLQQPVVPVPVQAAVTRQRQPRSSKAVAAQRPTSKSATLGVARAGVGPSAAIIGTINKQSLRQAIVMNEILGPPLALREDTQF